MLSQKLTTSIYFNSSYTLSSFFSFGEGWELTEEINDKAAVGEAAGGSAEEWAAIGRVHREPESGSEPTRIGVRIAEAEDHWSFLAPTINTFQKLQSQS